MKRFLSIFLASLLLTFSAVPCLANDAQTLPADSEIESYALAFMQESQETTAIQVDRLIHLYGPNDEITGYYVTFSEGDSPAGYLIYSLLSDENPLVEFSFEGHGILETASVSSLYSLQNTLSEEKILYTGPDNLYIELSPNHYYSVYDQETLSFDANSPSTLSSSGAVDIYDGSITWEQAGINGSSVFKLHNFGQGSDYWLMTDLSSGRVCTPTAATNVLWYWGAKRNSRSVMDRPEVVASNTNLKRAQSIFKILFSAMGTSTSGGTLDANIIKGYTSFFGESASASGTWNYKTLSNGSSFNAYKSALNDQCPVHLVVHTQNTGDLGEGHCMFVLGYANSTSGGNYLFVMDGWHGSGRFVKFTYYPYVLGYKIFVRS